MNRATLTKLHLLLAAFLFPVALMFLVTGGLYTWDFKGSYNTEVHEISLDQPLSANQSELVDLVKSELEGRSLSQPTGSAKIKKGGISWKLEWTGSRRDVVLEPTSDPLVARLSIKETTWYRNLVQLHKAKGGQLFKVYAAALAIGLFVILGSGFLMAWQVPKFRRLAGFCATAGAALFVIVVLTS
jgi:hypothetical protein